MVHSLQDHGEFAEARLANLFAHHVVANQVGLVEAPFRFEEVFFDYISALPGLLVVGLGSALIAFSFMNSVLISGKLAKRIGFKSYYNPIIPGVLCGVVGCFIPEVLGLGI